METPRGLAVIGRALGLLVRPRRTWETIALEAAEPRTLFVRYVAPMAAAPAVCGVLGARIFGFNIANVGVRMSLGGLVLGAAAGYLATLAAVYALAWIMAWIAGAFGGLRDREAALKVAGYAPTAVWVGGLSAIYPSLSVPVGILAALYSLYLLYQGLDLLLRVPEQQRLTAFAVALVAVLALGVARGAIVAQATELGGPLSASYAPLR